MKFYATSKISENLLETPEGYLICIGVPIARTGDMTYGADETPIEVGPDGTATVMRDAKEVFRAETLKSFEGKPVTIMHPDELVTPATWKELAKGVIQNVRRGKGETENDLVADLLITDASAIQLVKDGLREVSCGYEADYYELGVGRGEQKNIIGNHLALVTQGRAGSSYAINDHKGKGPKMSLKEILATLKGKKFAKADVEALRAVANDAALVEETPATPATYDDMKGCMDSMKKSMDEMMTKLNGFVKDPVAKDASSQPAEGAPAKVEAVDAEVAPSVEDRLKKLEEMVSAMMSKQSTGDEEVEMEATEDADADEEGEEVDDAAEEKEEKGEKKATGDSKGPEGDEDEDEADEEAISRAEILAPGIKKDQKNLKAKAIKVAYATTDGKDAIDLFTGGKAPDLKNEKFVDAVFVGVSEILKVKRTGEFAKAKTFDFKSNLGQPEGMMTPEKVNEMNAKHYGGKQ